MGDEGKMLEVRLDKVVCEKRDCHFRGTVQSCYNNTWTTCTYHMKTYFPEKPSGETRGVMQL